MAIITAYADATTAFELGFAPAAAAILSLGPQNTLVLRHGLLRDNVAAVVGACFGCDLCLIMFAVLGLGTCIGAVPAAVPILKAVGTCYLVLSSGRSLRQAVGGGSDMRITGACCRTSKVVLAALAVSLLNPLAWIESVLVIGAVSSSVEARLLVVFAAGAALGSLCKFSLLDLAHRCSPPCFDGRRFVAGSTPSRAWSWLEWH